MAPHLVARRCLRASLYVLISPPRRAFERNLAEAITALFIEAIVRHDVSLVARADMALVMAQRHDLQRNEVLLTASNHTLCGPSFSNSLHFFSPLFEPYDVAIHPSLLRLAS